MTDGLFIKKKKRNPINMQLRDHHSPMDCRGHIGICQVSHLNSCAPCFESSQLGQVYIPLCMSPVCPIFQSLPHLSFVN